METEEPRLLPPQTPAAGSEFAPLSVAEEQPPSRYLNREMSWLDFAERILALAKSTVMFNLVDEMACACMETERMLDMVTGSIGIDAAFGFLYDLMQLIGMVYPLTRYTVGADKRPFITQFTPEHTLQVVCDQFIAHDPAVIRAAMHDLHKLEWMILYLPLR